MLQVQKYVRTVFFSTKQHYVIVAKKEVVDIPTVNTHERKEKQLKKAAFLPLGRGEVCVGAKKKIYIVSRVRRDGIADEDVVLWDGLDTAGSEEGHPTLYAFPRNFYFLFLFFLSEQQSG